MVSEENLRAGGGSHGSTPFDREAALAAGELRLSTRAYGLSLGDRACLELGRRLGWPVLTTDRRWSQLSLDVEVRLAR